MKSNFARSLRIARDYLDPIASNCCAILEFKRDILDQKSPYFITESIGIQVSLRICVLLSVR